MGKKVKSKARNPRKVHLRASAGSTQPVSQPGDRKVDVGGEEVKDRNLCNHCSKDSAELNRVLLRILSSRDAAACEQCREEPAIQRVGKERGKQKKKGGTKNPETNSESHIIWVCLDCERCFCGGGLSDSVPYGHARRHAKRVLHPWAVRLDDPTASWCFPCNSGFPIEMPEVVADGGDKSAKDDHNKGVENGVESSILDGVKGHVVRGLMNHGNTCFFNSVLQNLFAIDVLRDYMLSLNRPIGPLTVAMKKLFVETSGGVDSRSTLNPKGLFSCICSRAPQFQGYNQQDSHELLCCLLDGLHMEEKSAETSPDSSDEQDKDDLPSGATMVDTVFGGQLSSSVSCMECGHTSVIHEPFLDLSLPVPSNKALPEKVPLPPPKKSKLALKERNRSQRFREKGTTKGSLEMEQNVVESFGSSNCTECSISASQPEQSNVSGVEESLCWLDYLEPSMADVADSDFQMLGDSVTQCSDSRQVCQSENNVECTLGLQIHNGSQEQILTSDSCGENSSKIDVPSSSLQDSGVILLPYKELNPTVEKINGTASCSQNPENLQPADASLKDSNVQTTSVACADQAEADFDGFGDLFNEPEVTSEFKADTGLNEEMDMTWWMSNSSDSNQEEVDNSSASVSVDSCLALFTKPELLSNEHGWYCEHCSEIQSRHNVGRRKGKQQYAPRLNQSEVTKSHLDGGEVRSAKVSPDSQVGCLNSTEPKVLSNGKMASTSKDVDLHVDGLGDMGAKVDVSQKSPNPIEGSYHIDFSSTNDQQDVARGESQVAACSSSLNHEETILSSSCENGDFGEVSLGGKNGSQPLGEMQLEEDSRDEEEESKRIKVKRDASKRILIDRAPPILTIHLKRFSQDARGRLTKLKGHVGFQETLSLGPYLDPRCEEKEKYNYRLLGLVEHSGSMGGGHYVAYVRGERGASKTQKATSSPSWFYASDHHVRLTSLSEVLKSEAYILFYERV